MFRNMLVLSPSSNAKQSGFSIVVAIFILVVLSVLAVSMVSLYVGQQTNSSRDLQGARAYQAARAGMEWGVYQVMSPENATAVTAPYNCAGSMGTPTFSGALQNFTVNVSCSVTSTTEGSNTIRVYQITSTATFGSLPNPDYVERQLIARLSTCRIGPGTVAVCG